MNNVYLQLLDCVRAFRLNHSVNTTKSFTPEDWQLLYQLCAVHKLVPVVYETLHHIPEFCSGNTSLVTIWKRDTITHVTIQASRTLRLLTITQELDACGITYAVLKGALCRQMYAKSDFRISGDEDFFIPLTERDRCRNLFRNLGLTPQSESNEVSVDHWIDSRTGLHIELHTELFSSGWAAEEVLNPYFSQALLRTVKAPVEQGNVRTLEPTAHFIFLVSHALKHFITGGFGVRTLCDILTFAEHYNSQIRQDAVYEILSKINGRIFFDQLLAIGEAYLDFDPAAFGWVLSDKADYADLLEDMIVAGIYGQTSMDRKHSGALALQAVKAGQNVPSLGAALFPSAKQLAGRYPILRQAPYLLPAMWAHRIGCYGLELIRSRGKGNSPQETMSLGKQRTEMMVKYGIIPKTKTKNR